MDETGYVFITQKGHYLRTGSTLSHGGSKPTLYVTKNLNDATLFPNTDVDFTKYTLFQMDKKIIKNLIPIYSEATRKVRLLTT